MERTLYTIEYIKIIEDVCFIEQGLSPIELQLPCNHVNFCLIFTSLFNTCAARSRPALELENMSLIKDADTDAIKSRLKNAPYYERQLEKDEEVEVVRGVISYISGNMENIYIMLKGNKQKYIFMVNRKYLVHWIYNIVYSFKNEIEIEMEATLKYYSNTSFKEIINVKPGLYKKES